TESQLRTGADVFPVDALELIERRALLKGTDVLATLDVTSANLRHQCEYELRSKLIGLRQAFLRERGEDGVAYELLAHAAGGAGGSSALFRHLLTLAGRAQPGERSQLAAAVAEAYGVDGAALAAPYAARREMKPDDQTARTRLAGYLDALDALTRAVDELPSR